MVISLSSGCLQPDSFDGDRHLFPQEFRRVERVHFESLQRLAEFRDVLVGRLDIGLFAGDPVDDLLCRVERVAFPASVNFSAYVVPRENDSLTHQSPRTASATHGLQMLIRLFTAMSRLQR